MKANDDTNAIV